MMIHDILSKLPYIEGQTFKFEGKTYQIPYETITVGGIEFEGLRDTSLRFKLFKKLMDDNGITFGRYLDIGCNIGSFVAHFSQFFESAHGVDKDPIIELGRELYPGIADRLHRVDLNTVTLKEAVGPLPFNVITALSMIEYVDNKPDFIKDLHDMTVDICIIEGHSEDITPFRRDIIYEELLKEQSWKVTRLPELTDAGKNAPSHSVGRPVWVCLKK